MRRSRRFSGTIINRRHLGCPEPGASKPSTFPETACGRASGSGSAPPPFDGFGDAIVRLVRHEFFMDLQFSPEDYHA
jgi:hypothetical protein